MRRADRMLPSASTPASPAATIVLGQGPLELSGVGGTIRIDGSSLSTPVTISGNDASRVFQVDADVEATIDSVNITHGVASGDNGGGIGNAGWLTLKNSTISDNAAYEGGGIDSFGTLVASNCTLVGNTAVHFGGGFADNNRDYTDAGTQDFLDCTFADNSANDAAGINSGGNLTVSGCQFTGNTVAGLGARISAAHHAIIGDSTLSGNFASIGGAINFGDGVLSLSNCDFSGNSAFVGGGMETNNSATTVSDCTFAGNSAPNGGDINNGFFGGDSRLTVFDTALSSPNPLAGVPSTWFVSNAAFAQAAVRRFERRDRPGDVHSQPHQRKLSRCQLEPPAGRRGRRQRCGWQHNVCGHPATNTELTVVGVPGTALKGFEFTGAVATFTDVALYNQIGDFQATIDWGDGQMSAGTINYENGQFVVSGTHTYATLSNFDVRTDVVDQGGAAANALASWSAVSSLVASIGADGPEVVRRQLC